MSRHESKIEIIEHVVNLSDMRKMEIAKAIASDWSDIISFDIFDTLVIRRFFDPKDLFVHMASDPMVSHLMAGQDFGAMRPAAEKAVVNDLLAAGNKRDPTLDEIYGQLVQDANLAARAASRIKREEISTEIAFARPRSAIRDLYRYALGLGKTVVICSDTYLPRAMIEKMLRQCGYDGWHSLFLSGECGATKKHGSLFPMVARALKVAPGNILHIGDNRHSDIRMAERAGCRAMFVTDVRQMLFKETDVALKGLVGPFDASRDIPDMATKLTLGLQVEHLFSGRLASSPDLGAPEEFGRVVLGPFILSLALWVRRLSRQKGLEHVAWLARDGWLPLEATKIIDGAAGKAFDSTYLPISRQALFPWFLGSRSGIEAVLNIRYKSDYTVRDFLAERFGRAGIDLFTEAMGAEGPALLDGFMIDCHDHVCAVLRDGQDRLREATSQARDNLVNAYRKALPADRRTAIFDVGRKGTFQSVLSRLTGAPLSGFYVINDYEIHRNAPGRSFDSFLGIIDHRVRQKNPDTIIYEALLSEQAGSFLGFDPDGRPLRRAHALSDEDRALFDALHGGALAFVRDAADMFGSRITEMEQEPFYAAYGLENWAQNEQALSILSRTPHDDPVSNSTSLSVAGHLLGHTMPRVDSWLRLPPRTERKRVMIYSPAMTRLRGGAERVAARVANFLASKGYELLIFSSGRRADPAKPVYDLAPGILVRNTNVRDTEEMKKLVAAYGPDAGIVLASGPAVINVGLAFLENRVPYLLSERASPAHSRKSYWQGFEVPDYHVAHEAANMIALQFETFRKDFPDHMRDRITVLPNPIEIPEPSIRQRERTILCVARIWFEQKRQDLLLEAFAMAGGAERGWRLKFFGNAYGDDEKKLATRAAALGISESVETHESTNSIQEQYERASIFVLPSAYEGFPNALAEALANGLPSIGYASCPGVNDLIIDGRNGLLVEDADLLEAAEEGNPRTSAFVRQELARRMGDALVRMMDDGAFRAAAGHSAAEMIRQYDQNEVLARWEEQVASLCAMDGGLFHSHRLYALKALVSGQGRTSSDPEKVAARQAVAFQEEYDRALAHVREGIAPKGMLGKFRAMLANHGKELSDSELLRVGLKRGSSVRLPIPPDFNETAYLARYPDVAAVVAAGRMQSGYLHYLLYGHNEKRERG